MVLTGVGSRTEAQHDPSDPLRTFVSLRDRTCDGPTGSQVSAHRCQLDHDTAYPSGPTAAWNLSARAVRTHQLKHYGWTPLRTATGTLWTSPAGQLIDVPRHTSPPPGLDPDPHGRTPSLPDATALAELDRDQLTAPPDDEHPPWLPATERPAPPTWTYLPTDPPF